MLAAMSIRGGLAVVLVVAAVTAPARAAQASSHASPSQPVVVKVSDQGFHWRDAGLGAAAGIAASLAVLGLVLTVRQAEQPGPGDARTPARQKRRSQ
jgi:hypothetical protein